jgi:hypothetical protein
VRILIAIIVTTILATLATWIAPIALKAIVLAAILGMTFPAILHSISEKLPPILRFLLVVILGLGLAILITYMVTQFVI